MGERKEVLSFMIYMWNRWCMSEAAIVFNNSTVDAPNWNFSLGQHIWNKWLDFCNNYGTMGAAERLVAELDESNLNKLVERACSLYCGRKSIKNN